MKSNFTFIKKSLFKTVFILLAFCTFKSSGQIDTLRHYNPSVAIQPAASGYEYYIARFMPKAPGYLNSLVITTTGLTTTGTATVHIYGHEGGPNAPELQRDLITPIVINKTQKAVQKITVTLPTPFYFDNTQFFVALSDLNNVTPMISRGEVPPSCSSSTGGDYYFQYYEDSTSTIYYDLYAFVFDAVMNYDEEVSPNYFQDVTLQAGIDTAISSRSIAWGDFNNDGFEDFIATGRLYKNNGNGTFTDITTSAGINMAASMNAFVDMNNDGLLDILIIGDYNKNAIFINNGNETFTEHDIPGMPVDTTTTCFAIADFNNDTFPDLYLGQLWHAYPVAMPAYLYTNDHNLGLNNVTNLLYAPGTDTLLRYACMFTDYDNDGKPDLYVANYYLERDELWHNNGNGTFTNVIADKGIDINKYGGSGHGTGVDWADYDNDGNMDLLLCMLAHPTFMQLYDHRSTTIYKNGGGPDYNFTDLIGSQLNYTNLNGQGIEYEETQAGGEFGDINNDGLQDIFLTAYYGCRYVKLYLQKPDHTFELKTFDFGLDGVVHNSDAVFADYDNDGRLDIAAGVEANEASTDNHFRLFRNTGPFNGSNGNFVEIDLKSISQNDYAIGGRVIVYAGGTKYMRDVTAGQGEGMQKPYRLHFGLGQNNKIDSVTVRWPNNTATEKFTGLHPDAIYTLVEGGQVIQGVNNLKNESAESLTISPNPFNDAVTLNYTLDEPGSVTLEIYSMIGEKVKTLVEAHQSQGNYQIMWDARDDSGSKLSAGLYMVSLTQKNSVITRKIVKVQ